MAHTCILNVCGILLVLVSFSIYSQCKFHWYLMNFLLLKESDLYWNGHREQGFFKFSITLPNPISYDAQHLPWEKKRFA